MAGTVSHHKNIAPLYATIVIEETAIYDSDDDNDSDDDDNDEVKYRCYYM